MPSKYRRDCHFPSWADVITHSPRKQTISVSPKKQWLVEMFGDRAVEPCNVIDASSSATQLLHAPLRATTLAGLASPPDSVVAAEERPMHQR
jgi:hypothetical protein